MINSLVGIETDILLNKVRILFINEVTWFQCSDMYWHGSLNVGASTFPHALSALYIDVLWTFSSTLIFRVRHYQFTTLLPLTCPHADKPAEANTHCKVIIDGQQAYSIVTIMRRHRFNVLCVSDTTEYPVTGQGKCRLSKWHPVTWPSLFSLALEPPSAVASDFSVLWSFFRRQDSLDEWSARRKTSTWINTYTYQTFMPCVVFEPTIPASEREKRVHALDRLATVTGDHHF
jgi:hypothetical protein